MGMELQVRERWAHLCINPYHSDLDGHGRLRGSGQHESCCRHGSGPAVAGCRQVSGYVSCTYRKGNSACCYPTLPVLLHFLSFLPFSSRRCHGLMSLSQKSLGQQTGPCPDGNFCISCVQLMEGILRQVTDF